ncbi:hypothetical protein JOF29_004183 [Kribbella aluminosa]|uniref:Uncharacterized protein n=1 Tax=Kribbella aluminosa TaxID=416017 RepID=A0ABS4UN87_9ACTN|nr:hypothetical protein [Kribbella aluminosa]MBP2353100.1 hypothetical protein [Kribbella aluminosa]
MFDHDALGGVFRDDSPFTLGDREQTRNLLTAAGSSGATFTAAREPIYSGGDVTGVTFPVCRFAGGPVDAQAKANLRRSMTTCES